jgi:hypothetical protein
MEVFFNNTLPFEPFVIEIKAYMNLFIINKFKKFVFS